MFQVKSGRLYSIVKTSLMMLALGSLGACQGRKPEEIKAPERSASRQTAGADGTTVTSPEQDGVLSAGKTDTAIPVQPKIDTGIVPTKAPATAAATPAATPASGTASTPTTPTVPSPGNSGTSGTAAAPTPWLGNSDRGNNVWKLVPEA